MRVKLFFIGILVFIISGFSSIAQNSSLLWEISGNGLKKPSYIYGTMHYPDKRIMELGDSVLPRLMTCDVVAGELDLKEKPGEEVLKKIRLPKDSTLSMLLYPEDYALVKKMAKERLGLLHIIVDYCKPMYVYFILMEKEKKNTKKVEIIDDYFQKVARKKKKKVVGLESIDEQLSALDAIKMEDQIKMLTDYVRYGEQEDEQLDQMVEIYVSQDLNKLDSFMVSGEMPDEFSQSVLLDRNYKMVDRIQKLILEYPSFIAVGAAHLPGNKGILELLRNTGYTVRPIISTHKTSKKSRKRL